MENFIPKNFIELLGGLTIENSVKLLALFIVVSLALFSNHVITYLVSIFIVATAVTTLEFLQNIAAIIRNNKEYFKYKKISLSEEKIKNKIKKENQELDENEEIATKDKKTDLLDTEKQFIDINRIFSLELKALDEMELYFGKKIERGICIKNKQKKLELDGLIESGVDDIIADKIIEVKYLKDKKSFYGIKNIFQKLENIVSNYNFITRKMTALHLVLIIECSEPLSNQEEKQLKKMIDTSKVTMGYSVFMSNDLLPKNA